MEHYVVTITRQFGSLGRPIARRLAEILDIEYYDRDLVEAAAEKLHLPVSVVSKEDESKRTKFFEMQFPLGQESENRRDKIFSVQREIILNIADRESCIIVGRCADAILKNRHRHISIYIYASYEQRLKNCIETLDMTEARAKKMIFEIDKARKAYHKHYAKYLPDDIKYKDIMIDSGLLGADGTAEYLGILVKRKFSENVLPFPATSKSC